MVLIKLLRSFRAWAFVEDFEPVFMQFNQCKLVDVEKASRVALSCNKSQITRTRLLEVENSVIGIQPRVAGNVAA